MFQKNPMSRRSFFAQMRKIGFNKSRLQLTRVGITYEKGSGQSRVTVTVPKNHESTFHILGGKEYDGVTGIFHEHVPEKSVSWGTSVIPEDVLCNNMLEVCYRICTGELGPSA